MLTPHCTRHGARPSREPKVPPLFGGLPFPIKHPRQSQASKCKPAPSEMYVGTLQDVGCCERVLRFTGREVKVSSKTKGPGEKGAPRNHPEISSQKLADFECRFPYASLGKRKHTPPYSSAELFFAEKNGGHRGKISVVDMAFLVFIGFLVSTTGLESFSFRPEKFPKRISFGGGRVRFLLLWLPMEGTEHHFGPFFWRRILGQYPAAPCSPGPFVLLLIKSEVSKRGWREGVGDHQRPKYSKNSPPKPCSPTHKGA